MEPAPAIAPAPDAAPTPAPALQRRRTLVYPPMPEWLVQGAWRTPALAAARYTDAPPVFDALERARASVIALIGEERFAAMERDFAAVDSASEVLAHTDARGAVLMFSVARAHMRPRDVW